MITGTVSANLQPRIRLRVRGPGGQEREIEPIVDTGFNGFLTLPPDLIAELGMARLGLGRAILANGEEELYDIYEAIVLWDSQLRTVESDASKCEPLVGMGLLEGHNIRIKAVAGGGVEIERLP